MKAIDLEKYLTSSGLFKPVGNVTMVEIVDGINYNRVPVIYKSSLKGWPVIKISIYVEKFGKNKKCVEFNMNGDNIFAHYTLDELNLPTLCKELNKIFSTYPGFNIWRKKELRNYKIDLLNEK